MEAGRNLNRQYALGLARAAAGAILFSFPMMMTMEMWHLGFYMNPLRLSLFIVFGIAVLTGLSYFGGFESTEGPFTDLMDALAAYAVGFIVAAVMLLVFGVITFGMSAAEVIGKIALQAVAASIGAMLARSQFDEPKDTVEHHRSLTYQGGWFISIAGALYLSLSVASTEEMVLISYLMSAAQTIALMVLSIIIMHALEYAVIVRHGHVAPKGPKEFSRVFFPLTIVDYASALLMSLFLLWAFGRTDGLALDQIIQAMVVLAFPAALGAGAARLLV